MLSRKHLLESRLFALQHLVREGIVPGQLDSIEYYVAIGRIKELQLMLRILRAKSMAELIKELKNDDIVSPDRVDPE